MKNEMTKNLRSKIAYEATDWKLRATNAMLLAGVGMGPLANTNVFADEDSKKITKNSPTSLATDLLEVIVGLFPIIGGFMIVAGGIRLLLAYRNNQPDEYSGAGKDIVIGGAFLAFKLLFWNGIIKPYINGSKDIK